MKHQLTQIRSLPVVAGDGKLPLPLADTGLPLYTRAMNTIDQLESGIQRKNRKIIRDAQLSLNGTIKFIQSQLCYEYSPIRAQRDNPELLDVVCFSGNLGRPLQHACCVDCILFDTNNNPHFRSKRSHIPLTAAKQPVA
jgi:hypothetical protein